jgi:hypothetical protein
MLARLHHYEELADHVAYFKRAYGLGWHNELHRIGAITTRGECNEVLKRKRGFTRVLLPRLRALRDELEQGIAGASLAKRTPSPSSSHAGASAQAHIDSIP